MEHKTVDLKALMDPVAIAVVGASPDSSRIGGRPIRALLAHDYAGGIYPVNPNRSEIQGLPCFPTLGDIPGPCDIAIVAVPASAVPGVIRECGSVRIGYAIVLSSGFAEAGESGSVLHAELLDAIADSGVRVIGPNCQGFLNFRKQVYAGFGALFEEPTGEIGTNAFVSQSGGYGFGLSGLARDLGARFASIVAVGNAVDLGILDFIDFFLDDEGISVVTAFMEAVRDGQRLRELGARGLAAGKPILVQKVGRSAAAQRAALSHTASMVGNSALFDAAFSQGAFIPFTDVEDLVDISNIFRQSHLPAGSNVGILTTSGGFGVVAAESCGEFGLTVATLSAETNAALAKLVPEFGSIENPVDLTGQTFNSAGQYRQVAEILLNDPAVDQLLVCTASMTGSVMEGVVSELESVGAETSKPVSVAWSARPGAESRGGQERLLKAGVSCFPTPRRAVTAMSALSMFAERKRAFDNPAIPRKVDSEPGRDAIKADEFTAAANDGVIGERKARALLARSGIPAVEAVYLSPHEVADLASLPLAPPLVVKIESPELPHKSESGVVRVGIDSIESLKAAAASIERAALDAHARIDAVAVQAMAQGLECIVGGLQDEIFGPVVAVGLGGIYTEVLQDIRHGFCPLTRVDAERMISELRGAPLLFGARGQAARDVSALADVLCRVSDLMVSHSDLISELDLNPVFVGADGEGAVAADALIRLIG